MSVRRQPRALRARAELGDARPSPSAPPRDDAQHGAPGAPPVLVRSKSFIAGAIIVGFWVLCAIFGELLVPQDPLASDPLNDLLAPSADNWFGTDQLGRDVFSRVIVGARDILIVAPLATLLGTVLGTALGLVTGYFRGPVDDVLSRIIEAFLALPVDHRRACWRSSRSARRSVTLILVDRLRVRPDHRAHGARRRADASASSSTSSAARLRNERTPYILFARDPAQRDGADRRRVHRAARLRDLRRRDAVASSASASSRPRRTGACRSSSTTA